MRDGQIREITKALKDIANELKYIRRHLTAEANKKDEEEDDDNEW